MASKQAVEQEGGDRGGGVPFMGRDFSAVILPSSQVERTLCILFVLRTSADNVAGCRDAHCASDRIGAIVSCKFHALHATLPLQPEKDPLSSPMEPPTRVGVKNVREWSLLRFEDPSSSPPSPSSGFLMI